MDEAQAGIKIARRNINNLRYADDTTVMAESEEELKSLLMKVKEESGKVVLKLSTTRFPVHHQLPEPTQIHVNSIGDTIQPSHPLSSLFLLLSIFHSIRIFSNELVLLTRWPKYWSFSFRSVLPVNIQEFPLGWTGWISLQSKGLSRVFSNTTVQKDRFFSTQLSL